MPRLFGCPLASGRRSAFGRPACFWSPRFWSPCLPLVARLLVTAACFVARLLFVSPACSLVARLLLVPACSSSRLTLDRPACSARLLGSVARLVLLLPFRVLSRSCPWHRRRRRRRGLDGLGFLGLAGLAGRFSGCFPGFSLVSGTGLVRLCRCPRVSHPAAVLFVWRFWLEHPSPDWAPPWGGLGLPPAPTAPAWFRAMRLLPAGGPAPSPPIDGDQPPAGLGAIGRRLLVVFGLGPIGDAVARLQPQRAGWKNRSSGTRRGRPVPAISWLKSGGIDRLRPSRSARSSTRRRPKSGSWAQTRISSRPSAGHLRLPLARGW